MNPWFLPLAAFLVLPALIKRSVARLTLSELSDEETRELVRETLWWVYLGAPLLGGMLLVCNLLLWHKFASLEVQQRVQHAPPLFWHVVIWSPYLLCCLGFDLLAAQRIPRDKVARQRATVWAWVANVLWSLGFVGVIGLVWLGSYANS